MIEAYKNDADIILMDIQMDGIDGMESNFENEINSDTFIRCHKSYLVNMEYIKSIKRYTAILENNEEVPLGRNKYKEIKDKLFDMIEDK